MKKSIIDSQESSNPEGLEQPESSASSDVKQIESLGSSDLKQSDSDDQVMESSSKKSSSSTATTVAGPFTSERKLRSSSSSSDVEIVKIKHTTPFYGQKFIEEVNRKKNSLMDSDVKTKYKQEFLSFPNTNPAVIWRRI